MPSISEKSEQIAPGTTSTISLELFNEALAACFADMLVHVDSDKPSSRPFFDLIEQLRPTSSHNTSEIAKRFNVWISYLERQPAHATRLANYVLNLLTHFSK